MVRNIFTREPKEETSSESDSKAMRYPPKLMVEDYKPGRLTMHVPNSTVIVNNNTGVKSEIVKTEKEKDDNKENAPRKKKLPPNLPKLNLSTDTYATNIYCQVGKILCN